MKGLGLVVETLEKTIYESSPLGTRVSVDQIYRDCELEISRILLIMDLRVMYMSEFDRCHPWDGLVDGTPSRH